MPALHINGGGASSREEAEREFLSAIAFAQEGDPRDYDTDTLTFDMNYRQQPEQPGPVAAFQLRHGI